MTRPGRVRRALGFDGRIAMTFFTDVPFEYSSTADGLVLTATARKP